VTAHDQPKGLLFLLGQRPKAFFHPYIHTGQELGQSPRRSYPQKFVSGTE
jgi:hypothetical protein